MSTGLPSTARSLVRTANPAKLTDKPLSSASLGEHPPPTVWNSGGTSSWSTWQRKEINQMALQAKLFISPHPPPDCPPDSSKKILIRSETDTLKEERKAVDIDQEERKEAKKIQNCKEEEAKGSMKHQEDKDDSQVISKPYLLMPGPEASRTALSASCQEVTAKEEDFSGSSSSSSGAADHHHLIGKHPGGSGGKGARFHLNSNYSLHELACQAASTGAALNCAAGVPPVVGTRVTHTRGEKTTARPIRAGLDSTAMGLSMTSQAVTPGGITASWGNTA